jgi:hypothetical protein
VQELNGLYGELSGSIDTIVYSLQYLIKQSAPRSVQEMALVEHGWNSNFWQNELQAYRDLIEIVNDSIATGGSD